jgi:hypothetical protein
MDMNEAAAILPQRRRERESNRIFLALRWTWPSTCGAPLRSLLVAFYWERGSPVGSEALVRDRRGAWAAI